MLREGVKFHDGSDFDSGDVVDLLKRIKDPELDSPVASVLAIMDSVEAIDPLTVKITLSAAHADFPMLIMDYRIRMTPEGSGDTIGQTGIGTGPFILETLDPEGTTIPEGERRLLGGSAGYRDRRDHLDPGFAGARASVAERPDRHASPYLRTREGAVR